jgi:hypothetical protein
MDAILRAVYDNNESLWFATLKRRVEAEEYLNRILYGDTFRLALRKLRDLKILENKTAKNNKKRVPIRFVKGEREKYAFEGLEIPNTYVLQKFLTEVEPSRRGTISKKRREETEGEKGVKAAQFFLLRGAFGTTYWRKADPANPRPGQVAIPVDSRGNPYNPNYLESVQKTTPDIFVDYILCEGYELPGVSITDILKQRDRGCGGVFLNNKISERDAQKVMNDLVNRSIMKSIGLFDGEMRYGIADDRLLQHYVEDWGLVLFSIVERMRYSWLFTRAPRRKIGEEKIYEWYYSVADKIPFSLKAKFQREYIKTTEKKDYKKMVKVIGNGINIKIREILYGEKYNTIERKYPGLQGVMKKVVELHKIM